MRRVLIAAALLLGLVAALAAALPWLAKPALEAGLRLAGQDRVEVERVQLGWDSLEVEGIALGPADQQLTQLRVDWRWPDVLQGRLEQIVLDGLTVHATWRDGRLELAGIETGEAAEGTGIALPDAAEMVLRDARVALSTELGTLELPLAARMRRTGERLAFEASIDDGRLDGIEGAVLVDATLEGELPGDVPVSLDAMRASGSMAVAAQGATLGIAHGVDGRATLGFDLAEGALHLDLALDDADFVTSDLDLGGVSLHQRMVWRHIADDLALEAEDPGTLAIESLMAPDLRAGPLRLHLEPAERPLFALAADPGSWRASAAVAIEKASLHLTGPALDIASSAGVAALALEGGGQGLVRARVDLAGGQLTLPQHRLTLEGIAAEVALTPKGLAPGQVIPVTVAQLRHGGRPAWFVPLKLQGTLVPGDEGLTFEAELGPARGGPTLGLRGEHRASGSGRATVTLPPVTFGPGLQPKDLSPLVAGLVSDVAGQVALNGDLAWSPSGVVSDLAVLVDQLGLTSGPARLAQVNGVIQLDGILPPTTPPRQQLAIGLLDLGLPLTEGVVSFQLQPGPRLAVDQLTWRLAGGTARAQPFSLGSAPQGLHVTLRAEQLQLGPLLALTKLDGLSGEGSLDGVLPIRLAEGAAIIEGGKLAATRPGVLRYATEAAPGALQSGGQGVDLLLQALENFHYEALKITLDGRTDAAMDIGLHLGGANPDLYGGHPIEFNLDLQGELGNILRQGVASYQIPDRVRERMQGFGR